MEQPISIRQKIEELTIKANEKKLLLILSSPQPIAAFSVHLGCSHATAYNTAQIWLYKNWIKKVTLERTKKVLYQLNQNFWEAYEEKDKEEVGKNGI